MRSSSIHVLIGRMETPRFFSDEILNCGDIVNLQYNIKIIYCFVNAGEMGGE